MFALYGPGATRRLRTTGYLTPPDSGRVFGDVLLTITVIPATARLNEAVCGESLATPEKGVLLMLQF